MALEDFTLHDSNVNFDVEEKLKIIRNRAKVANLADLDLEKELLDNYNDAQDLYDSSNNEATPANQKAQVLNSINSILDKIVKMRTELYNAERIKKIEASIIYVLEQFPEMQEPFMKEYERALKQ